MNALILTLSPNCSTASARDEQVYVKWFVGRVGSCKVVCRLSGFM